MRTELQAYKGAVRLLARMKGRKWKMRVWENLGWHYAVENGHVSVSPSVVANRFMALLMPHYSYYGACPHGTNPNKVVDEAVALVELHAKAETIRAQRARQSLTA